MFGKAAKCTCNYLVLEVVAMKVGMYVHGNVNNTP